MYTKQEMLDHFKNIFEKNSALPLFMKEIIQKVIEKIHEEKKEEIFHFKIFTENITKFDRSDSVLDEQLRLLANVIQEIIPDYKIIIFLGTDNPETNMEFWFYE